MAIKKKKKTAKQKIHPVKWKLVFYALHLTRDMDIKTILKKMEKSERGSVSQSTLYRWKQQQVVDAKISTLERIFEAFGHEINVTPKVKGRVIVPASKARVQRIPIHVVPTTALN